MSLIINYTNIRKQLIWVAMALMIYISGKNPGLIEQYYSMGIYPYISTAQRILTGWCRVSIGDLLYCIAGIYLFIGVFKWIKKLGTAPFLSILLTGLRSMFLFGIKVYVVFMLAWGLNYSRVGISAQLHVANHGYDKMAVTELANTLIDSTNAIRKRLGVELPNPNIHAIFSGGVQAYNKAKLTWPFLAYGRPAIKSSMYTPFADYAGFLGYYNPFSGEAQLRADIPKVMLPYIVCHEMAHQLGYASEDEANFAAFLTCSASDDLFFRYSVYLDLLNYTLSEQYLLYVGDADYKAFEQVILNNRTRMDMLVKADRKMIRSFFDKRRNSVAPVVSTLYDQYLQMNKQMAGIKSYELVIGWLIAYKEKYGKI